MEDKRDVIVSFRNIKKEWPGVVALNNFSLDVYRGECLAVCGENGAGKSTLMRILSGVFPPTEGCVEVEGDQVTFDGPRQAQQCGISIIHQEFSLTYDLSVAENIFLGRLPTHFGGFVNKHKLYADAKELMEMVRLEHVKPAAIVGSINPSQQQQVEIAKALSLKAKLIIMDEPTSTLTKVESEALFGIISMLKKNGITILYITHKLEEVFRISDRAAVLRDGELVATTPTCELDMDQLVTQMVGRAHAQGQYRTSFKLDYYEDETVLEVKNLSAGTKVRNVSFNLYEGEVLGVTGLVGAGRSELVQCIFGADPADAGSITVRGTPLRRGSSRRAIAERMALVPEGRKAQSLFLKMSLRENMSVVYLKHLLSKFRLVQARKERKYTNEYIKKLDIKMTSIEQLVTTLSGGNQQKAILARWLMNSPDILLLDEPTQGIDIATKRELYRIINKLIQAGVSIILVTSEMEEVLLLCDRVLVMREGEVTAEFMHHEADSDTILRYAVSGAGG